MGPKSAAVAISEGKRTGGGHGKIDAFDPQQTSEAPSKSISDPINPTV
jgi:hypothetical protein